MKKRLSMLLGAIAMLATGAIVNVIRSYCYVSNWSGEFGVPMVVDRRTFIFRCF